MTGHWKQLGQYYNFCQSKHLQVCAYSQRVHSTRSSLLHRKSVITQRVNYYAEAIIIQKSITTLRVHFYTKPVMAQRNNYTKRPLLHRVNHYRGSLLQSPLLSRELIITQATHSYPENYYIDSISAQGVNYYTETQLSIITHGHNTSENPVCLTTMSYYSISGFQSFLRGIPFLSLRKIPQGLQKGEVSRDKLWGLFQRIKISTEKSGDV